MNFGFSKLKRTRIHKTPVTKKKNSQDSSKMTKTIKTNNSEDSRTQQSSRRQNTFKNTKIHDQEEQWEILSIKQDEDETNNKIFFQVKWMINYA